MFAAFARYIFSLSTSNLAELSKSRLDVETWEYDDEPSPRKRTASSAMSAQQPQPRARSHPNPTPGARRPSNAAPAAKPRSVEVIDITGDSQISYFTPNNSRQLSEGEQAARRKRRREARRQQRVAQNAHLPSSTVENGNISFHNDAVIRRLKLQCSICLEPMNSAVSSNMPFVTQCGHIYHKQCIRRAMESSRVRPSAK